MHINRQFIQYVAAAIVVMMLGGLVGWFVFVRGQIQSTSDIDAARGVGVDVSSGGSLGSSLSNISGGASESAAQAEPAPSIGLWGRIKAFFSGSPSAGGVGTFSEGGFSGSGQGGENVSGASGTGEPSADSAAPKLWQITRTPVAGLGFSGSTPKLFFVERASGNVLRADPLKTHVERVTNTLFPKTLDATFASDGSVILRSLGETGEVLSYMGSIATSSAATAGEAPNKLEGAYLPRDVLSVSVRSSPKEAFFLIPDPNGGSVGITANWQGSGQKRVFSSPLSGWRAILVGDGTMYVLQKASDDVSGFLYRVLPSGALERVVGNLPGLLALPKTGSRALLYSTSERGIISLFARTTGPSTDKLLSIKTVADKCVWGSGTALIAYCAAPEGTPTGTFLQDWYSGKVHTSDAWWKVDVAAGTVERMQMPESEALDVAQPTIDASGAYIAFVNAIDRSLWMISLNK